MTYWSKKDVAQLCKRIGWSGLVLALAACNAAQPGSPIQTPPTVAQPETVAQPKVASDSAASANDETVVSDIQAALAKRKQEYDALIQQAQMRGLVGGALQGGLLVMLVTGSPEGAFVGGVAGGAMGHWVAVQAATQIVEEHRNFLIRKWSIETVLEAARTDTENTRFDLLLSERALEAARIDASGPAAIGDESVALLSEFRERAEGRALVLHEVMPIFADDRAATERLSVQLKEQVALLSDMRKNVDEIVRSHD